MSRPHVTIDGPNRAQEYETAAIAALPKIISRGGVLGVTLNGGVSRGYADELSEIDLTVYLVSEIYKDFKTTKAPIPFGITVLDGYLFDIKTVDYSMDEQAEWEPVKLWDASYAKVLYDPDGKIADLLAEKLRDKPTPDTADGDLFACWWCFKLAGDIWLRRGDTLQGHLIMNQAVQYLLKALFLLNGDYVPHEKWLLHLSRTLLWTPPNWEDRLMAAMLPPDSSPTGLKARQDAITALWSELDARLKDLCGISSTLTFRQHRFYTQLKLMAERKSMSAPEFDKHIGLALLNYPPYYQLLRLENGMVVFDEKALDEMTPEQVYSWQYEIIETLR